MISVEFRSVKSGTCGWCRRDRDEVYDVSFSDKSFVGPMCKGDLLRAIGMKVGVDPKANGVPPIPVAVQAK
jgi:hypothetical protein